ncbi:MAG: OsmC family protein [Pseudomonadota bacterium]
MFIIRKDKKRKPGIRKHNYEVSVKWNGNTGHGTRDYMSYSRESIISTKGKPDIIGSSDIAFLGNSSQWNPEEMLVASLSVCHELWFLALASINEMMVVSYTDKATGLMIEREDGAGAFQNVTLRPNVKIIDEKQLPVAHELHHMAHEKCFIANSVNFDVLYEPKIEIAS